MILYTYMKQSTQTGFIIPTLIVLVALGAATGVWFGVKNAKESEAEIDQVQIDLARYAITQELEGVTAPNIKFVSGNSSFAWFRDAATGEDIYVKNKGGSWDVIDKKDGINSCEQLVAHGFTQEFLYDCTSKYEKVSASTILSDTSSEAILVGILEKSDECTSCVQLTTSEKDRVVFVLKDDFDDGDYSAVNVPDDSVISVNGEDNPNYNPQNDSQGATTETQGTQSSEESTQNDTSSSSDTNNTNEENTSSTQESTSEGESSTQGGSNTEGNTSSSSGGTTSSSGNDSQGGGSSGGAEIVEEIADAEETTNQGSGQTSSEGGSSTQGGSSSEESSEGQTNEESQGGSNSEEEGSVFDDDDDEEIINYFDLDSSQGGVSVQVIGDPSEDRSER